ncbi:unnamed protein product, partial [Staurois parvus]
MASRDTHGRRLADAQQQVASREPAPPGAQRSEGRSPHGIRLLPGAQRLEGRGPHSGRLLQGPSDQQAGALTAASFSRGPATSRQGPSQRPASPGAQRPASPGPSDQQAGALTAA